MRYTFCLLLLFLNSFSQKANSTRNCKVSFIATVDTMQLTKDGIWLNGYVVNIPYEKAKELHGRKIKITGKVTIVKGLKNLPKEYSSEGSEIIKAGREDDTRHIENPKIQIVKN